MPANSSQYVEFELDIELCQKIASAAKESNISFNEAFLIFLTEGVINLCEKSLEVSTASNFLQ